jgi:putative peptidoglycan lipid II flippase
MMDFSDTTHSASDKQMLRSSLIVSVLQAVGVLVAYAREMAVAREFGSQTQVDQYYIAFTIVTLLPTLTWNVGWAAFVPIFMRRWQSSREEAWRVANVVFSYLLLFLLAGCVVTSLFAGTWIRMIGPGLAPQAMESARRLLYVLVPVLLLMGINVQLMAVLNGLKLFGVATISQALPSLFSLVFILAAPARFGIVSLAWGWSLGSVAQTLVLLWQGRRAGYRFLPSLKLSPDLRELAGKGWLYLLPSCSYLGLVLVDRYYASRIGTGAIAVLNYGDKIFRIPMVVLTTSLFTVSLSYLAEHTAAENFSKFRESLSVGLRFAAFLLLPTALLILILRDPIVSIAYQRGAFTVQDCDRVAATLRFFAPLVVVHGIWFVLERSMIALGRFRLLAGISVLMIATKIAASAITYRRLGVPGLVLSNVITFLIALLIMYAVVLKRFGSRAALREVTGIGHLLPAVIGSGVAGLAIRAVLARIGLTPVNLLTSFAVVAVTGGGIVATFLAIASTMRSPELLLVGRWLHTRIARGIA